MINNKFLKDKMKKFIRSTHFSINENTPRKEYCPNETHGNIHWGQLKLFTSELLFLNHYFDGQVLDLVYVGAAGGNHISLLSKMFPTLRFHLYDSAPFSSNLKNNSNIFIYPRYFMDDDVNRWKDVPCLFISDIRNMEYDNTVTENTQRKHNSELVWKDMCLQRKWVEEIKPVHSLLKFKLPYSEDFEIKKGKFRNYLDGTTFLQCFAKSQSNECRLHVQGGDVIYSKDWDIKEHEEKMYYHNSVVRKEHKFENPIDETANIYEEHGLLNDFDSTFLTHVVIDYLEKIGKDKDNVKFMLDYIFKNMNTTKTIKKLRQIAKRY